jgi:hypothetical protein
MTMRKAILLLAAMALATLLTSGVVWAAAVAFAPAKNYAAGDTPNAVSAGDFDGDGDTDLATSNSATDKVSVLIRRYDGTFRAPRSYAMGDFPADIIGRVDFDGDGDLDLATVNIASNNVSVRLGRGDGTFLAQRKYAADPTAGSIESGDFDGDGDADLVTANSGGGGSPPNYTILGTVSVFLNRGDGTFGAARNFVAGRAYEPGNVDRSDLDGDGDEDLVVALGSTRAGDGGLAVLLGKGDGTFGAPQRYDGPASAADVLADDLDGDGDSDLAATDSISDAVTVSLNKGDGTFLYKDHYFVDGVRPRGSLTEADFDRDGDLDIATANPGALNGGVDNVSVLMNVGDGTLGSPQILGAGSHPLGITRARMNADRKPDLVVANMESDNVSVLLNTTP